MTTVIAEHPEYVEAREQIEKAIAASKEATSITDDASAAEAADILGKVSRARKYVDGQRLKATKPHRDEVDSLNGAFKELLGPLTGAEQALKAAVLKYRKAQQAKVEEERRHQERLATRRQAREDKRAEEQGKLARQHQAPVVEDTPQTLQTATAAVTVRKVWKHEIVDPDQIPDRYFVIDEKAIAAAVRSGERSIPGVRIFEDEIVGVR